MRFARSAKATRLVLGATLFALTGSVYAGIDGSGVSGIDGSGANGIDGSGGYGIDGSGGYGIDGSGGNGIDGSGGNGIDSADVLAGPVDAIDRSNGVFHSLGQVVMASDETLNSLQVGDFVNVQGSIVSEGWLYADTVDVAAIDYVPGATEVFVAGMLSQVDNANGTARLGGLTIDYTPSLAVGSSPSDATWSFRGTRPATNGPMVSEFSNDFRAR